MNNFDKRIARIRERLGPDIPPVVLIWQDGRQSSMTFLEAVEVISNSPGIMEAEADPRPVSVPQAPHWSWSSPPFFYWKNHAHYSGTLGDFIPDPSAVQAFQDVEERLYLEQLHAALERAMGTLEVILYTPFLAFAHA